MAANAYWTEDFGDMPVDLQMDLLVDAELTEPQRVALLSALNARQKSGPWKDLALRFLQRQLEKDTVRELISGGTIAPQPVSSLLESRSATRNYPFRRWTQSTTVRAAAAGVLIAATSAVITLYTVRGTGAVAKKSLAANAADVGASGLAGNSAWSMAAAPSPADMYRGAVPVEALGGMGPSGMGGDRGNGLNGALAVEVPIAMHRQGTPGGAGGIGDWMPAANDPSSRRSVVIQPDGQGNAVIIPVSTVNLKFY